MSNSDKLNFNKGRLKAEMIRFDIKSEWKELWEKKYDDEKISEGISIKEYSQIEVEQGQIIYATRKYKPLDFYEILEKKIGKDYKEKITPSPKEGGWRKFAKQNLSNRKTNREKPTIKIDLNQQQRKHGKGWLNQIRISKKINEKRI